MYIAIGPCEKSTDFCILFHAESQTYELGFQSWVFIQCSVLFEEITILLIIIILLDTISIFI